MNVFVTGAGMIGCHTIARLGEAGDKVTLFDLAPREDYIRRVTGRTDVDVVQGDIRDLPLLMEAVERARPDVVFHTAAMIGGRAHTAPYLGFQVNIMGTINVAETVRLLGVRRLVHASSLAVHDISQPQPGPIDENFPTGGRDGVYQNSKVSCELVLRTYAATYKFELAMLRFASAYGYGHFAGGSDFGKAFHDLVMGALEGRPATRTTPLSVPTEYVYVKDLADGIAGAVHAPQLTQRIYNLGTGILATPDDVLEALKKVVPGVSVGPIPPATIPALRQQPMDISAAARDWGYKPRYSLEDGFRDYVEHVRADA